MSKLIILVILSLSLNSFARSEFFDYNEKPITRKQAVKLTKQSVLETNFYRIERAAKNGECNFSGYKIDENVKKQLESLGYEVTSDEKGGYLITWCD